MALITICGYPCSGKSTRASQIQSYIQQRLADPSYDGPQMKVVVISDNTLNVPRSAYDESRTEKPARGSLLTSLQRHTSQDTILVIDAPNYIKGFRYQMYCIAREAKIRVCTVYTLATPEVCKERDEKRPDGERYKPTTLDNLIMRFEEPSSMVRWDSPLITIPWTDEGIPGEEIWKAVMQGEIKAPNAGTQAVPKAPSDALHTLEQTTSSFVSSILTHQQQSGGVLPGGPINLSVSPTLQQRITLPARSITLSELQRLKRQFVTVHKKAITLGTVEKGEVAWEEESVAQKFAVYLEENLRP